MASAAKDDLDEGQLRHLKSTRNKLKTLKLRFGTRRLTGSKPLGKNFKTYSQKLVSEHEAVTALWN